MFKKDKKQYINVLRNDKQIKLDASIFTDNKLQKTDSSSFLSKQIESAPEDMIMKLQIQEKNIPKTFISTITSNPFQKIVPVNELNKELYNFINLNEQYCVVIPKSDIEDIKHYFSGHIDYLYSPFSLLYEQTAAKASKNSLNVLIKENKLFVILFDQNSDIKLNKVHVLTPFDDIKQSQFYEDEISGQKLYDEVYFLEIQQVLSDLIQLYYQEYKDTQFVEEVNIFYTINQLSDEQLDSLHETLMAKINYYYISYEEKMKILSSKINAQNYSFIDPRVKKEPSNFLLWGSLAAASLILTAGVLYFKSQLSNEEPKQAAAQQKLEKTVQKQDESKQAENKPEEVVKNIELPSHTKLNDQISKDILTLFDIIPFDAVLKELQIDQNNSTIVCNFIADSTSPNDMKEILEKIYQSSQVILSHQNEAVLSSIITNENKIKDSNSSFETYKQYTPFKYVSIEKLTTYLESILPKNSKIEFLSKKETTFTTYNFKININIKDPKEFFSIAGELNKKDVPLNISYPVEFAKLNDSISVMFNLQYHQKNKE